MSIEHGGRPAPDHRLEGEMRLLIPGLLKENTEGEELVSLYAIDPENEDDYNREGGNGELQLSHTGDLQIKQIEKGVIFWKVVSGLPARLKNRLRLDEASARAVEEYQKRRGEADANRKKNRNRVSSEPQVDNRELELRYFKLEQLQLKPQDEADKLISRVVLSGKIRFGTNIDIESSNGQKEFCRTWKKMCGLLPMPCVPPEEWFKTLYPGKPFPVDTDKKGDFWYLKQLADELVVDDLGESNLFAIKSPIPDFGQEGAIYVMDWKEINNDTANRAGNKLLQTGAYTSPLLQELGITKEGVVNISRQEIDNALWEGDPGDHKKTAKHTSIIDKMGFKSHGFEFRCIRHEEYTLLASQKKWGQHNLYTHFDNYVFDAKKKSHDGLCGGGVRRGGASLVTYADRNREENDLAVRLVLARV